MRALAIVAAGVLIASNARASSVEGYPEQGSEALGRGGAWVARASDPIAIARNPAGLAGQPLRLSIGEDVAFSRTCLSRTKAANDTTDDGVAAGASYPRVCDDGGIIPVGYAAMAIPVTPRFAIGAGIVTPTGIPRHEFPTFADGRPSPQRYLLIESTTLMAIPTLGAAYEVIPGLRLGGSLGWGIAWVRSSAAGAGLRQDGMRPDDNDMKVTVTAHDLFVPRATFGAHASLGLVEIGGAFTWSAPIDATGDARTEGGAFAARVQAGDTSKIAHGDTSRSDCGQPGTTACGDGGNAHLTIPIPLEATVGVRVRIPRPSTPSETRDPMETELGDVELDATWAQNSAIDRIGLQFPGVAGNGTIPVVGTAGDLPPNADSSRRFRDVVGFRLGGDLAIVPGVLAIRAGTFVEPRAAVPGQVGLETLAGTRIGIALGLTARIRQKKTSAFDVSLGFLHVFVADVTESDPRADGVRGITGTRCDGSAKDVNGVCPDGAPAYRTKWPVGLGTISGALDVLHLGVAYRF